LPLNSEISEEKIAAFQATHYRVGPGPGGFVLCIGRHSLDLHRLYLSAGQSCGVFITAFNPFGEPQSDEANETAHAQFGGTSPKQCSIGHRGVRSRSGGPLVCREELFRARDE
jgi:hypothetical protein